MSENTEKPQDAAPEKQSTRDRLQKTLSDRAGTLKAVQTEVYTVSRVRFIINFILGLAAVALLIVTIVKTDEFNVMLPCLIAAIALVAVTLVMYFVTKFGSTPMSYLQYSVKTKDGEYVFQAIARDRSVFGDGTHVVEYNKVDAILRDEVYCPELSNDYFSKMTVNMRVGKAETETFYGTLEVDGKTKKCKIVFKNGVPDKGNVGARRIRYYSVNDRSEEFVLPAALKDAVKTLNVPWPDGVPGVRLTKPFDNK